MNLCGQPEEGGSSSSETSSNTSQSSIDNESTSTAGDEADDLDDSGFGLGSDFDLNAIPECDPLFPGSSLSLLSALATIFSWFTAFPGVSKEALGRLLFILHKLILPSGNSLPASYASAYAVIKSHLVRVEEYHCCVNDCVVYRGAKKDLKHCPECLEPRFLADGVPRKRFKYLPLGPRIKRLFGCARTSQLLQSHSNPVDQSCIADIHQTNTWKRWYSSDGIFGGDPRGLSLSICADGTNPFSKEKCSYSMMPITLSLLNLHHNLRRKAGFLQLVGIIPGRSEAKNTDPYLDILVDELSQLDGSNVFDAFQNNTFSLKVNLLLHIFDYPGQNKIFHCHGEIFT